MISILNGCRLTPVERKALRLLGVLGRMGGGVTVGELGEAMGLPGSIAVIATKLAQKGYLRHPGATGGPIVRLRDELGWPVPVPSDN